MESSGFILGGRLIFLAFGQCIVAVQIFILEFTIAPFFTAILLYLLSNFLPVNIIERSSTSISDYFLKHAFFLCFTLMWLQLLLAVNALGLTTQFSLLQQSQYVYH